MPKKNDPKIEKRKDELLGLFLITFAAISIFAVFSGSAGLIGNTLKSAYYYLVGIGSYLLPFLFIYWGVQLIRSKKIKISQRFIGFIIIFISIISIIDLNNLKNTEIISIGGRHTGGIIGGSISSILVKLFAYNGAYIILSVFMLIGLLLFFDLFLHNIFKKIKAAFMLPKKLYKLLLEKWNEFINKVSKAKNSIMMNIKSKFKFKKEKKNNEENLENAGKTSALKKSLEKTESSSVKAEKTYTKDLSPENIVEENRNDKELREDFDISRDQLKNIKDEGEKHGDYTLPGISLLNDDGRKKAKLANKSELLEETLSSFGVDAEVINVNHGPKITRYEIQPAVGVKVSKIVTLSDDIALSLAAKDVRIEAPIPGKAAVGIEVPHGSDITVSFRDVVVSEEFQKTDNKLNLALGKGIDGDTEVFDLTKMPHLLVAGATGSGKSVCINTLICSILYRAAPNEVKLLLIDPKKVELNIYKGLPHLLTPVVTDPKKAANVLKLVVEEMEDRYDLFSDTGSRGIESYNNKMDNPEDKLPYIVVVIDELSDLMMVAANEVEDNICRLAQMSRAAGIHLIIATQRPSVDVITGLIKANIPSRISFAVSSATDSRTILDMGGAEKLLGKGDMLFAPVGVKKPIRIQGAFLTDKEINKIIDFIKSQAKADYKIEKDDIKEVELSLDDDQDELYEEAVQLVVKYRASISMLQRRLHIGHSRAARLIDTMEEDGIVGPYAGSKPREVLVEEEELEKILNDDYENTENIDN
jgi:S-DNA-T family DNA segregation ATPase FtsK/SpoIIIE